MLLIERSNTMKTKSIILILFTCMILTTPTFADYEITWSTIDGGGGTSTGGNYALVGITGQPDAGQMSGGDYVLSGGFWPTRPQALLQCFVNFEHFATFAMYWLDTPCNEGNNYCEGADLDYYGDVDLEDVKVLAYYWLLECPPDWPWQ